MKGWIPRPWFVGEIGDVYPLLGDFLPILSGTVGLMKSLCISRASVSAVTEAASAFDVAWSVRSDVGERPLRGSCSGLLLGSSFSADEISDRPVALLHGSTGGAFEPNRPIRSVRLAFFFSGPDTDT